MKDHPIIFSSDMVNDLLDGRKTQTRRVIKPQPQPNGGRGLHPVYPYRTPLDQWNWVLDTGIGTGDPFDSPYGVPGNRLWVRETLRRKHNDPSMLADYVSYVADYTVVSLRNPKEKFPYLHRPTWGWKRDVLPSIFMPRWASRITLLVKDIRVERVQDIEEHEVFLEGMEHCLDCDKYYLQHREDYGWHEQTEDFMVLWDSINKKRGYGWDVNPWVWVIEFEVEDING